MLIVIRPGYLQVLLLKPLMPEEEKRSPIELVARQFTVPGLPSSAVQRKSQSFCIPVQLPPQ